MAGQIFRLQGLTAFLPAHAHPLTPSRPARKRSKLSQEPYEMSVPHHEHQDVNYLPTSSIILSDLLRPNPPASRHLKSLERRHTQSVGISKQGRMRIKPLRAMKMVTAGLHRLPYRLQRRSRIQAISYRQVRNGTVRKHQTTAASYPPLNPTMDP